ncbi:BTAD domain-containing putative transcriptional regulator [Cohnella kolymensis]|nr:BTAD domain-containing putative transcriptional regulator [Cohnella kolymensis]
MPQYRMTLVHAEPGYGKTTALCSFFRSERTDVCWYSADEHDGELPRFLTYVVEAIRTLHPGFGDVINSDDVFVLCESVVNELISLPGHTTLVIDDYQLVGHTPAIDLFMQHLVQRLPANVHVVLSGRTVPNWSFMTAMKVKGELLDIGRSDLAFSEEEIEVLFADYYDYPLQPETAKEIFRTTEGWAVAVQFIWQRLLYINGDIASIFSSQTETMEDLFRFLALEVLDKQPPEIQTFLEQTSILEHFDGSCCDQLFGMRESKTILENLSGQNVFLIHSGERNYRYHPLFREFLVRQLQKKPGSYTELQRKAASYFESNDQIENALNHLHAADEWDDYARLLNVFGRNMIDNGQLEKLRGNIDRIPKRFKDEYFMLWIYEGDIYRYRSVYDTAIDCYLKGEKLAEVAGDSLSESLGLEGQARIYLDTIQPGKAETLLARAIAILEAMMPPPQDHLIRIYSLMAENLVNLGRAADAELWYERCRSLRTDFQEELLEARLHLRTGRLKQSKQMMEASRRLESAQGVLQLPRSHRETDILLSLIESMLGNPEEAKRLAQSGLMQGIHLNAPFVEACGWMRMGHAAQLLPKYDFAVSLQCYQTSLEMMERLNVSRGRAEPLLGLCLLYGREGSYDMAMQYGRDALSETEKVKDEWLSTLIRSAMGIAAFYGGHCLEAGLIFGDCLERYMRCGDSYGATVTLLWQTMIAYQEDKEDQFRFFMDRFLRMAQTGNYEFLIQRRTLAGPRNMYQLAPLLIEAQTKEIQPHYVNYLLTGLGMEHMTYHPGYALRIETLGGFQVWLGDKAIVEKDWQRGKAKELFQLLACKRQQLMSKDEIISLLFRELDEKSANRDFKVALNALNTTLEPQRRARSTPFFILRHGSSYGLNLASGLELDTVEFESWIRAGLEEQDPQKAAAFLDKGLKLYKGDYLPDRQYEDWSADERERLQSLFLRAAERMAKLDMEAGRYEQAINWCEKILEKDSCSEEAYRLLMRCHYKMNNRSQALKWYQKCCKVLERELGVKPMIQTTHLYESLQSDVTHL